MRLQVKFLQAIFFLSFLVLSEKGFSTSYTWTGTTSTAWGTSTNWSPNGIPGSSDNVTIVSGTHQPSLSASVAVANFTMTSGTLTLSSFTLTCADTGTFNGGTINSGTMSCTGNLATYAGTTFGANVTANCGDIYLNGSTFNGTVTLTKNGGTDDASNGGNTFNSTLTVTNSSNHGFSMGEFFGDVCNSSLTMNNTGSSGSMVFGWQAGSNSVSGKTFVTNNSTGSVDLSVFSGVSVTFGDSVILKNTSSGTISLNQFGTATYNGNISLNNTSTGSITFGSSGGSSTLASGKTISVGTSGFTGGSLSLTNFTQNGTGTPQSFTLSGTSSALSLTSCAFNSNINFKAAEINELKNNYFTGTTTLEATTNANTYYGGNTFNGAATLTNSGNGNFFMGQFAADVCNSSLTLNNTGSSGYMLFGYDVAGNSVAGSITVNNSSSGAVYLGVFSPSTLTFTGDVTLNNTSSGTISSNQGGSVTYNGNIVVNNTGIGSITFGSSGGNATLASGKTISVGLSGFATGTLSLANFTQSGTGTPQTLTLTSSATLIFSTGNTFNSNLTASSPSLYLNGTTFNGTTSLTQTSSANTNSNGGNNFNGATTITNSGSGYLLLAEFAGDNYYNNVNFVTSSTGPIYSVFGSTDNFYGNITTNGSIDFHTGNGTTVMAGFNNQTITVTSGTLTFYNFTLDKNSINNTVTLSSPVSISGTFTLTGGRMITTSTNLLTLSNGATAIGGSKSSYVDGPITKVGSQAFTYPVGNSGLYMPIGMSAPVNSTDAFQAQAFKAAPSVTSHDGTIAAITTAEYWNLTRTVGTSTPSVTLIWNYPSITPIFPTQMLVAQYTGTQWTTAGGTGLVDDYPTGSITSSSASYYNSFTLAYPSSSLLGGPPLIRNDTTKNWTNKRSFDENGALIGELRSYSDKLGRVNQVFCRNQVTGSTYAVNSIYDPFGRPVMMAIPGPSGGNDTIQYNPNILNDPSNHPFDFRSNNLYEAVYDSTPGTVGWYYSNNNTDEPYIATTSYPYNSINYTDTVSGGVLRHAGPGDSLRMGSGHEKKEITLPLLAELNHYLSLRSHFVSNTATPTTMATQGTKSIKVDENGIETITFKDRNGKVLASAMGTGNTTADTITSTINLSSQYYYYNLSPYGSYTSLTNIKVNACYDSIFVYNLTTSTLLYSGPASFYTGSVSSGTIQVRAKSDFNVTYTPNFSTGPDFPVMQRATESGTPSFDFYIKSTTGFSLSLTNAYTGMTIRVTNLQTGAYVYAGAASSYTPSTLPVPGFYRMEVTSLPPYQAVDAKYIAVTYKFNYYNLTYNYYDDRGRLVASVAPKGVNPASTANPKYTTTYTYSTIGTKLTETDPDRKTITMVYRKDGRLRFSQNLKQKSFNANKFTYINYDQYGRVAETGELDPTLGTSTLVFQAQSLSPVTNSILNILQNTTLPDDGLPSSCSCRISKRNVTYSTVDGSIPIAGRTQRFVQGQISKTYNANNTTWFSYDELGRVEWTIETVGTLGSKTIDYTYDMLNNIRKVVYQNGTSSERWEQRYLYDANNMLQQVQSVAGTNALQDEAMYYYYEHGPLKRKEIADSLQGVDYTYTVQGWLKTVNHPTLDKTKDPGQDGNTGAHAGFATDVFGEELQYFDGDYSRSGSNIVNTTLTGYQNYFNGTVKGMRWETSGQSFSGSMGMYAFSYDPKYQLTGAQFGTVTEAAETTFTSSSNYNLSNLTYDINGNILSKTTTNGSGSTYDGFTYDYSASGTDNRLLNVKSGVSTYYAKYSYDSIGQMVKEVNSVGDSMYLVYDVYHRVTAIYSNAAMTTKIADFLYDEHGHRIEKTTYAAGVVSYHTWYVRDASGMLISVYDDKSGTLGQTELEIYAQGRIGIAYNNGSGSYSYDYELTDHLGNVRATISRTKVSGQANILSWADYYPFGDIMPGRSLAASPPYKFDYQGQNSEKDPETSWNHFDQRDYDARTGRWLVPDPMSQFWSPYMAMGNDWVTGADPTGGFHIKIKNPIKAISHAASTVAHDAAKVAKVAGNIAKVATVVAATAVESAALIAAGAVSDQPELVAAGIGGAANVIGNANHIKGNLFKQLGEESLYFGAGAIGGALTVLAGPAAGFAAAGALNVGANAASGQYKGEKGGKLFGSVAMDFVSGGASTLGLGSIGEEVATKAATEGVEVGGEEIAKEGTEVASNAGKGIVKDVGSDVGSDISSDCPDLIKQQAKKELESNLIQKFGNKDVTKGLYEQFSKECEKGLGKTIDLAAEDGTDCCRYIKEVFTLGADESGNSWYDAVPHNEDGGFIMKLKIPVSSGSLDVWYLFKPCEHIVGL